MFDLEMELEHIFRPFEQEDGTITRKFGGTGLGLSICHKLAELMGGSISVESTLGEGSCFTLNLPLPIGNSSSNDQEQTTISKPYWDGPPLRVLLVEDDDISRKFGSSLLKKLGLNASAVINGQACLAILEKETFDIVLMDIQMPIMSGDEALKNIRSNEQETLLHQPIIALTAFSLRGEKEKFLVDGFDGFLSKPIETKHLINEIKRVLECCRSNRKK